MIVKAESLVSNYVPSIVVGNQHPSTMTSDEDEDKHIVEKLSKLGKRLFENNFDTYCQIKKQCESILQEINETMMEGCPPLMYENIQIDMKSKKKELIGWAVEEMQKFSLKCGLNPNYKVVKKTANDLYKETSKRCNTSTNCSIEQFEFSFKSNFLNIIKKVVKDNYEEKKRPDTSIEKEVIRSKKFTAKQYALIAYYLNKHNVFRLKELPDMTDKVKLLYSLQNLPSPSNVKGSNLYKTLSSFLQHGFIHSYSKPQTHLIKDLQYIKSTFEGLKLCHIVDDIDNEIESVENQYSNRGSAKR